MYLVLLEWIDFVLCGSFQQSMQLLLSSMLIISPYLQPLLILSRIKNFIKRIDDLVWFDSAKELMGMKIIGWKLKIFAHFTFYPSIYHCCLRWLTITFSNVLVTNSTALLWYAYENLEWENHLWEFSKTMKFKSPTKSSSIKIFNSVDNSLNKP